MGKNGLDTLEISNPKVLKCILPTCAVYYDDATSEARLDHAPINRPKDPWKVESLAVKKKTQGLRGNPVNGSNIWSHERRSTYFIIRYISIYETRIMYPMKNI